MMVSWVNQYSADMCGVSGGGGVLLHFRQLLLKLLELHHLYTYCNKYYIAKYDNSKVVHGFLYTCTRI